MKDITMLNRSHLWLAAILCAASGGKAVSVETITVVPTEILPNARQPQTAIAPGGMVHMAYGAGESIYCSTSTDHGKSYGSPVKIGDVSKLALGRRRGPRIAAGNGFVVVTAIGHHDGNVLAWRSMVQGKRWEGPFQVNDSNRDAREGLHAMAAGPMGQLYCVWLDCREQSHGSRIFGAGSKDGGKTWTVNHQVYRSPSGSVCECCHPSVAYDSQGGLHVMWRNSIDGKRDLYVASSPDDGETFTSAVKLGAGSWPLEACPMDGGSLAATGPGELTTIWRREKQIFRTVAGQKKEQLLGQGEQPWAAANRDGAWLVWLSRRGGDLYLAPPGALAPVKIASRAIDPVIAAPTNGMGPVVVAWETGDGRATAIMAALVGN